jgi:hypothetical protein
MSQGRHVDSLTATDMRSATVTLSSHSSVKVSELFQCYELGGGGGDVTNTTTYKYGDIVNVSFFTK